MPSKWQDEPTEPGWYWVEGKLDAGPVRLGEFSGHGIWEALTGGSNIIAFCLDNRRVMPVPKPSHA